jgi:AraC-like DNA-binding protein
MRALLNQFDTWFQMALEVAYICAAVAWATPLRRCPQARSPGCVPHRAAGRQFSSELLAQSQPQGVGAQLTAWLRPRIRQQIDIEQMAAACALSVRTLHRKLRQQADVTPAHLLARLRTEMACALLEQPGMTVKQAARQSGYSTEYNLRRAFAAQLGVLPSEYQSRFA